MINYFYLKSRLQKEEKRDNAALEDSYSDESFLMFYVCLAVFR